jgi:hypothetical protein
VLALVSQGYSEPKGRFPRVTHPCATPSRKRAFDLHVLGLPPAFVLSQDQTLTLKKVPRLLYPDTHHGIPSRHIKRIATVFPISWPTLPANPPTPRCTLFIQCARDDISTPPPAHPFPPNLSYNIRLSGFTPTFSARAVDRRSQSRHRSGSQTPVHRGGGPYMASDF